MNSKSHLWFLGMDKLRFLGVDKLEMESYLFVGSFLVYLGLSGLELADLNEDSKSIQFDRTAG